MPTTNSNPSLIRRLGLWLGIDENIISTTEEIDEINQTSWFATSESSYCSWDSSSSSISHSI